MFKTTTATTVLCAVIIILAGVLLAPARAVYAYTATLVSETVLDTTNNHVHGIQSLRFRNVRYQGILPDTITELVDGTCYMSNDVEFELDIVYPRVESAYEYLDRYVTFDTDIIITPASSTNTTISNVQIEYTNIHDGIYILNSPQLVTNNNGQVTYKFRTTVYAVNAQTELFSGTTNNRIHLADYKIHYNYKTDDPDNYTQVQTSVRTDYVNGYLRAYENGNSAAYQEDIAIIVNALAESGDVEQIITLLTQMSGYESQILTTLGNNFPTILSRLMSIITAQGTTNDRLYDLYTLIETWYYIWESSQTHIETGASQQSSEIAAQSSEVQTLIDDMTFSTINPDDVVDNALDIAIEANDQESSILFLWVRQGIVPSLLIISVTFAIIGFVIYGKG